MTAPETGREAATATWRHWSPLAAVPPPRRRLVTTIAVVALLVVAAVVGCVATRSGPADVVTDYLETLRSGDVETAMEYVRDLDDFDGTADELLTAEAMSTDWEAVVLRERVGYGHAFVDVAITAADKTVGTGRFDVQLDDDSGDWEIRNPLAKIDLSQLPVRFAEFNGVTADIGDLKGDINPRPRGGTTMRAWLFPGPYRAFGDSADTLKLPEQTFVATPGEFDTNGTLAQPFLPEIAPGSGLTTLVTDALADWLGDCAESAELSPGKCPFSTRPRHASADVQLGGQDIELVDTVKWTVETAPTIELVQVAGGFAMQQVETGVMGVSGEGTDSETFDEVEFDGKCEIDLDAFVAVVVSADDVEFWQDDRAKQWEGHCWK